jgi:hypothetical protein
LSSEVVGRRLTSRSKQARRNLHRIPGSLRIRSLAARLVGEPRFYACTRAGARPSPRPAAWAAGRRTRRCGAAAGRRRGMASHGRAWHSIASHGNAHGPLRAMRCDAWKTANWPRGACGSCHGGAPAVRRRRSRGRHACTREALTGTREVLAEAGGARA